jgi:hypothetical protein
VDEEGCAWKFCTKCVCRKTGQKGLYTLSHYNSEHKDSSPSRDGNLATLSSSLDHGHDNPLEFQGAWYALVAVPLSFFGPPLPPLCPPPTTLPSINPTFYTMFDFSAVSSLSLCLVDCCVPAAYSTALSSDSDLDPAAFLLLWDTPTDVHPIIFDTGASLAITPSLSDFDGPLSLPKGDLRLGGMANGMRIEGLDTVTWDFVNTTGPNVRVQGLAYYVPASKARLLSPQCVFNPSTGVTGHYKGGTNHFFCVLLDVHG